MTEVIEEPVTDNAPAPVVDNAPETAQREPIGEPEQEVKQEEQAESNDVPDAFKVPDEYKEKGWAKNVKSLDDLYKNYDNAQELIGKKTVQPDFENASDDDIKAFYEQTRPENHSDYTFGENTPEENVDTFGKMLHENGISKYQGDKMIEQYQAMESKVAEEMFSADGMTKELQNTFGDDYANKAKDVVNSLAKHMSDEDRAMFNNEVPNKMAGMMYRFVNKFLDSHGARESTANAEQAGTMPKTDVKGNQSEIRAELTALSKRQHTAQEKQVLVDALDKTYR